MTNRLNIEMPVNALSATKLSRLKWATMVAVIGIPVLGQVLGAMILFSGEYPFLTSALAISAFSIVTALALLSGLYVLSNRMHLRFMGLNRGLDEWEIVIRAKAQAFSYKVIFWGMFVAFLAISGLGLLGLLKANNLTDIAIGQSLHLNLSGLSAMVIGLFYLIFFLPTLYMAWTLKPLSQGEDLEDRSDWVV